MRDQMRYVIGTALGVMLLCACSAASPAPTTPTPGLRAPAPAATTPAGAGAAPTSGATRGVAGDACATGREPADPGLLEVVRQSVQLGMTMPYRDVRLAVLANDGTFARVLVCMQMRRSATDTWHEYAAEYGLSSVAGRWRVERNPLLSEIQTAAARATQEASTAAAPKVHAEIIRTDVRDTGQSFGGWKDYLVTVRWTTDDRTRHVVGYTLSFAVSGHTCLPVSSFAQGQQPRDTEQKLYLAMPVGANGQGNLSAPVGRETVGPDPVEKGYIAGLLPTMENESLRCSVLDNPRDLQLSISAVDGTRVRSASEF